MVEVHHTQHQCSKKVADSLCQSGVHNPDQHPIVRSHLVFANTELERHGLLLRPGEGVEGLRWRLQDIEASPGKESSHSRGVAIN